MRDPGFGNCNITRPWARGGGRFRIVAAEAGEDIGGAMPLSFALSRELRVTELCGTATLSSYEASRARSCPSDG